MNGPKLYREIGSSRTVFAWQFIPGKSSGIAQWSHGVYQGRDLILPGGEVVHDRDWVVAIGPDCYRATDESFRRTTVEVGTPEEEQASHSTVWLVWDFSYGEPELVNIYASEEAANHYVSNSEFPLRLMVSDREVLS